MIPCIVIVHDIFSKHVPSHGSLDLHITLHWLCQNFTSSKILLKVRFSVLMIARIMIPCIITLQARTMTRYPWPTFHAPLTLSEVNVTTSSNYIKVCFSVLMVARMTKPCIVIVLNLLSKHTPWPGTLDLHVALHLLCQIFYFTSSKILKCFSLYLW